MGTLAVAGTAFLLTACGGGHEEDAPLTPSYAGGYHVTLNLAVNTCGGSLPGTLVQVHQITQADRNILVSRDNIAYQGTVETDNKGFAAYSLAMGRPDPEGTMYYRNTVNPNVFTVEQIETYTSCVVVYRGTSTRA
ncbi:MAG: hypothetical protein R3E94_18950 [Burkholderiaceae bacterium]